MESTQQIQVTRAFSLRGRCRIERGVYSAKVSNVGDIQGWSIQHPWFPEDDKVRAFVPAKNARAI